VSDVNAHQRCCNWKRLLYVL